MLSRAGARSHKATNPYATYKESEMTTWKKICRVEDIPVLGARRVARDRGLDVAVFRNDADEVFALLDR